MSRQATQQDFIIPEFRGEKPENYEVRGDGKVVRKDRWERAVRKMSFVVGIDPGFDWEIEDIIIAVENKCENTGVRSDQEIIDQTNKLAVKFASIDGLEVDSGYTFHTSAHPIAKKAWAKACIAQELITGSCMEAAIANLED